MSIYELDYKKIKKNVSEIMKVIMVDPYLLNKLLSAKTIEEVLELLSNEGISLTREELKEIILFQMKLHQLNETVEEKKALKMKNGDGSTYFNVSLCFA